jgi:hypothetical protein
MVAPVVPNQFEVGENKIVHTPTKAALRVRLLEWRLLTDLQIYSRLLAAVALNLVLNGLSFVE